MGTIPQRKTLLRIFLSENDRSEGHPAYKQILKQLRDKGIVGATVLRGIAGFGPDSRMHDTHLLAISDDLPLIIEAVDEDEKIRSVLAKMDADLHNTLVTLELVEIYKPSSLDRK